MDKGAGWNHPDNISAPLQRAIIVSLVAVMHVAAFMLWLKHFPVIGMPSREMEVAILVAPEVMHAENRPLQAPHEMVPIVRPHPEKPVPQPPQPAEEILREREAPVVVTGGPVAAVEAAPAIQPVEVDTEPDFKASYLNNRLIYPLMARRMGIQGRVVLDVEVLADGLCGRADVAQSSGHDVLDRAALESVRTWQFVPARHGSQAVTRWFKVPITFSLKDDGA
jgi:protein TonB